jgi:hypothetical protein
MKANERTNFLKLVVVISKNLRILLNNIFWKKELLVKFMPCLQLFQIAYFYTYKVNMPTTKYLYDC